MVGRAPDRPVGRVSRGESQVPSDPRSRWLEVVRRWQLDPSSPGDDDHWSPELDRASPDALREIQSEKVQASFAYLHACSPFYRRKFEAAGLQPRDVASVDDLWKVPITRKAEWVEDQAATPPWGTFSPLTQEEWTRRGWMFFATSGTTALPRAFRHTLHDRDLWSWIWARALWAQGVRPGDVLINCFGYGPFVAFWGAHYGMNLIGCPVIPAGGLDTQRRAVFIHTYEPTVLICTPSYALFLAETAAAMGHDPAASSIRLVVTAGEPGPCIAATKRRVERAWDATMLDIYGCTEMAMAPLGYQCLADGQRAEAPYSVHLLEDCYVAEALDPDSGEPSAPGEPGVSVVSNLFSEAQPILRYEMGDVFTPGERSCPCGRTHRLAVGGFLGRTDDMLKVRGIVVYPATFESVIRAVPGVGDEFEVIVDRADGGVDEVLVRVEAAAGDGAEPVAERTIDAIRAHIGLRVRCEALAPGSLERPQMKARRVHDRRAEVGA
jgi:phenylacetate-CoA ligase